MKKKLLIGLAVLAIVVAVCIGYLIWSSRNTAQAEAERVLVNFTEATQSQWYCENGSGKGIDNQTSWWEEIYLSNNTVDKVAEDVKQHLGSADYGIQSSFVERVDENIPDGELIKQGIDWHNRNYSYWLIEGRRANFTVTARISNGLTLNNCFDSSNKDNNVQPSEFNTKTVVKLRDTTD